MANKLKKIGLWKWIILYVISGVVDLVQFIITWTGVGIVVNEVLEAYTGIVLIGLMFVFRINLFNRINRIGSLVGGGAVDAITGGAAPFWVVDIIYIHSDVRKEEAQAKAQQEQENMLRSPQSIDIVKNGIRQPRNTQQNALDTAGPNTVGGQTRPRGIPPPLPKLR